MDDEGFYEGERIHQPPPETLSNLLGADAGLYVAIKRWNAKDGSKIGAAFYSNSFSWIS